MESEGEEEAEETHTSAVIVGTPVGFETTEIDSSTTSADIASSVSEVLGIAAFAELGRL